MAHGWDSYFPNLQPLASNPGPLEASSGPEENLSQPIENFTEHHDLSNMMVSQEAVSTNSDFGTNLYPNPAPTSDCAFKYFSDIPWQADEHQSDKDGSPKCENGDLSNVTADGLTISSHFPSFAADLQEIKEDCEILAPSFLEDYSDVSSCSDTDINETEIRPSCKYMKNVDSKTASHDNVIATKHSPPEWPFTPTGNMSISADFPNSQISEMPLILPVPSELHNKARETADCAEEKVETQENPSKCYPTYIQVSSKTSETENDQEDDAGTEQKLEFDMEEERVCIQAKELTITVGSHKDTGEDKTDTYPVDCGKECTSPKVDECQENTPHVYDDLTSILSVRKDLDVTIQETSTTLLDRIQDDREVCDDEETTDPNEMSSPGLHENGANDTSDTFLSSATKSSGLIDGNASHSQDTIHELDDNTGTLDAVEMTNDLERTMQGISQFQLTAKLSSESCLQDIICSNQVEDSKSDSMDACCNKQLSDFGKALEPLPESDSTDPLHQPKLHTIMDEEKTLQSCVAATELHKDEVSETIKESFQETCATVEQPDLDMLYGQPLSRVDSPCEDDETSNLDQESPVASLERSNITHSDVQVPELKHSLQLQRKLQPIIILKTLEPVNDIKEYRCTGCQYATQNVDNLIEHHHSHSPLELSFCPTCNIYLLNGDPPSKHVCDVTGIVLPEKIKTPRKQQTYTCNTCLHVSHKLYKHVQHMRTHTGITPFKCKACGQYYSQCSSLYKHVRVPGRCPGRNTKRKFATHLNIKSKTNNTERGTEKVLERKRLPDCYVKLVDVCRTYCPYCRKTFPSLEMTNKHMSRVHKVKGILGRENCGADEFAQYKCPLCPRVFKYSNNRARHLRLCIKEQTDGANWNIGSKYQCPLCKVTFSIAKDRTQHMQNTCVKKFLLALAKTNSKKSIKNKDPPSTTTDLQGIRPYKCSLCPASFFNQSGKYKHMKKHELCKLTGNIVRYKYPILKKKQENIGSKKTVKCTDTSTSNFSTSVSLKERESNHKGDRPYRCLECGERFRRLNHLIKHKTVHQRRIQCTVCKKILPTIAKLIKHRKAHLKRGKLKCPDCPQQFDYAKTFLRHLSCHKHEFKIEHDAEEIQVKLPLQSLQKPKVSQCTLCPDVFLDPQSLRKHCLTHILESSLQCPFCHQSFNGRRSLVRHIDKHSGGKPLTCNACGKRFHRIVNLNMHKKTCSASEMEVNKPEVVEKVTKLWKCSYCPRTFTRPNRLKTHHASHRSKSLVSCSKCSRFYGRAKLSQHDRNFHGSPAIDRLDKGLPNEVEDKVEIILNGTKRTRTKTYPHICPHCPQRFQYRSLLLRHLNSHKAKSCVCDHCGCKFGNRSMCIKHEESCGGFVRNDISNNQPRSIGVKDAKEQKTESEAEYKCKFCTKTFLKARSLRRHILTHTEVKPYRCKACDSCFSRYDHLKLHQNRCKGKRRRLEVCLPKISLDAVGKGWQKQGHRVSLRHNKSAFPNTRRKTIGLCMGIDRLDGITAKILEPHPIKKQRNACIYCPRSFKTIGQLGVHTRLHTGEKPFLCDMCGEQFIRKDYLIRHSSKCNPRKDGNDLLPCNQCEELFPKDTLETHQIGCSNGSVSHDLQKSPESTSNGFSCAYCNSTFLIFSQLQQHFLNAHKQDAVKSPVPTTSLQQHLSNIMGIKEEPADATTDDKQLNGDGNVLFDVNASEEKPFPCSFCNMRFKNKSGLGSHVRNSKSHKFSCHRLKKTFKTERNHLRTLIRCEKFSKKDVGLKSVSTSSEIGSAQSDSVLVFKEGSQITHRGTGVLQTNFSCKDYSEDSPQENQAESSPVEKKAVRYQCSECEQSFTDGLLLISHLEDHGRVEQQKNSNTCPECGKVCNSGGNLNRHMKIHGIDKTYPCLECSKRFSTLKMLLLHKKHHKIKPCPFVCRICSQRFWTNKSLKGHYSENHPTELHFCKLCSKRYTLKKSLYRHYKIRHHVSKLDQYIDCSENESMDHGSTEVDVSGSSDKEGKTDEEGDIESGNSDSDAAPYFPCHVCGKTFLTSENLEDHQRCHLGEKPHECAECGKCFFQASQLVQHQRTHKSEFQCQTCYRGFMSLFALRKHKHTHGKSRPYRCSKCDLSFTGHSQLAEHMAMHREDNFPCDICNRTFSCKSSRAEHRKSHSAATGDLPPLTFEDEGEQGGGQEEDGGGVGEEVSEHEQPLVPSPASSQLKYRCGVCHDRFKYPAQLSEHGCLEAEERPFSCSVCDQYFLHDSHLQKHKALHHKSYEYLCNQCHIQFSSEKSFLFHLSKYHHATKSGLNIKEEEIEETVENSHLPQTLSDSQVGNNDSFGLQNPLPIHSVTHECTICFLTFPTKSKLEKHERCHSSAATQFECTSCGQNFLGSYAFKQHHCSSSLLKSEDSSTSTKKSPVRTLGEEEEVDVVGEDAFNCFVCSEQFSTKSCLLEHQNEHHPKEILKCEICGKTFKERMDLIQHERTHIAGRDTKAAVKKKKTRLSCFQCAALFDTVQEMANHLKTHCHQDLGQHRCDMCYKSFSHWTLLKKHQESHVGEVVYECTECDKAFAFPHLLEEHQLTHAGPSK